MYNKAPRRVSGVALFLCVGTQYTQHSKRLSNHRRKNKPQGKKCDYGQKANNP